MILTNFLWKVPLCLNIRFTCFLEVLLERVKIYWCFNEILHKYVWTQTCGLVKMPYMTDTHIPYPSTWIWGLTCLPTLVSSLNVCVSVTHKGDLNELAPSFSLLRLLRACGQRILSLKVLSFNLAFLLSLCLYLSNKIKITNYFSKI